MKHPLALLLLLVTSLTYGQPTPSTKAITKKAPPKPQPIQLQSPVAAVQAPPVSNGLPLEFVRQMSKLTDETIDDPKQPSGQSMIHFIAQMKRSETADKAVDSLFGINEDELPEVKPLYRVKLELLRFLLENTNEARRMGITAGQLKVIEGKWKKQYLRSVVALIRVIKISKYDSILSQFTQILESDSIELVDLSPANRIRLDAELGISHGVRVTDKNNDVYTVKGLFANQKNLFAVDLSQNFEDSIVTLSHEIVHVGDPELQAHRSQAESLFPIVKSILKKISPNSADEFMNDLLGQVFFELGRDEVFKSLMQARQTFSENLKKDSAEAIEKLNDQDKSTLRSWLRAVIGSTIENEYKAYGLSIVVYHKLHNALEILPPSQNMDFFVQRIIAGDAMFANDLSLRFNPFKDRHDRYRGLLQKYGIADYAKVQVDQISNLIQATYLDQLQIFINGLNNEFADLIKSVPSVKTSGRSAKKISLSAESKYETPDCVNAKNFNSPVCPFSIIGARISTMQIVKFRENLNMMLANLQMTASKLYTLRAGILDLSDLTIGDLEFLGIFFAKTRPEDVRINYDIYGKTQGFIKGTSDLPSLVRIHSKLTPFDLDLTRSKNMIAGDLLVQELLKLRILRGLTWLDDVFPNLRIDILGMKMTIEKLRTNLYNPAELTKDRANELQTELIENLEMAQLTPTEISKIAALFEILSEMHFTSVDFQWKEIANNLQSRASSAKSTLEKFGFHSNFVMKDFQVDLANMMNDFRTQLAPIIASCKKFGGAVSVFHDGPYKIKSQSFPLSTVCYNGQLHLVRQPLDTKTPLSVMVTDGRPAIRMFSTGRMIQILPFEFLGRY